MERSNKHNSGFHEFFRGIILFGFTMLLLSLILSGSIKYYIAPKMMPFIYFALVVFLLLSIMQIIRSTALGQEKEAVCDCGTNHRMTGSVYKKLFIYSIFVLPLLMGFVLPEKVLDSSVAVKRGVQLGSGINSKPSPQGEGKIQKAETTYSNEETVSSDRVDQFLADLEQEAADDIVHYTIEDTYSDDGFLDYYDKLAKELLAQEHIVVTDENYLDTVTVLDLYLDDFINKSIEIEGFAYREPGMEQDELVTARFSMTCCTADSAVYGLLVKGEKTRQFENDTWLRVVGTIEQKEFNDWIIPSIKVETIEEIEKPESPYVYPSY